LASVPEAKPYGTPSAAPVAPSRVTVTTLAKMAAEGQRIAMLTAYDEAPLLIVNSERLNFVDNPAHLDLLLARIASMRSRREFFNLGQHA